VEQSQIRAQQIEHRARKQAVAGAAQHNGRGAGEPRSRAERSTRDVTARGGCVAALLHHLPHLLHQQPRGLAVLIVDVAHRDADHVGLPPIQRTLQRQARIGCEHQVHELDVVPRPRHRGVDHGQPQRQGRHVDLLGVGRDEQPLHRGVP